MIEHHLLTSLMVLPLIGVLLILINGTSEEVGVIARARGIAVVIGLASLALCVPLLQQFNPDTGQLQFIEKASWIPFLGINYHLGVDGIALPFVVLTVFISLLVTVSSWRVVHHRQTQYLAAVLFMQSMMIGAFSAMDAFLFYVFWEAMLIPMYLLIGVWGSSGRAYAAIKFFLYTLLGSVLMLVAILYLWHRSGSFTIGDFYAVKLVLPTQIFIFIAFCLAFAVKIPMWPVHTWLPDAHTEAPAGGSVILAAIMLKMGAYGFLRFLLPIVPDACRYLIWVMIGLSLIAVVYIGLVAIVQTDMKRLIAYSSISHMGIVTLGCFLPFLLLSTPGQTGMAALGVEGALFQMLSHAFTTSAMFLGVGVVYDHMHTRRIRDFGGVANHMPVFAALFMLFALGNVGLPGTSGFVGEFMVLISAFKASFWIAFAASFTLILSAVYTLWMYKRVFFGRVVNKAVGELTDVQGTDRWPLVLLAVPVLIFGVYPQAVVHLFHGSVEHLLTLIQISKL